MDHHLHWLPFDNTGHLCFLFHGVWIVWFNNMFSLWWWWILSWRHRFPAGATRPHCSYLRHQSPLLGPHSTVLHDHLGDTNQESAAQQHHLLHLRLWCVDQCLLHGLCCYGKVQYLNPRLVFRYIWVTNRHTVYSMCLYSHSRSVLCCRYLVISQPLWYRFRRTIRVSLVVCVIVWTLSLVTILFISLAPDFIYSIILFSIFLLLPFPVLVFSLVGTLKSLSASIAVHSREKQRIVGVLILVLLNYTLLFLPTIILSFCRTFNSLLHGTSFTLIQFSPLANLVLYVFMRKGTIDHLPCGWKIRNRNNRSSVDSRLSLGR